MTDLKEIVKYLIQNGYLIVQKERYLLTAKFNREMLGVDTGVQVLERAEVTVKEEPPVPIDWVAEYQNFIMEAKVPKYSSNAKGEPYEINRATKPGRDAYKKAITAGYKKEQLLLAVSQYYKEGNGRFRVKIETWFVDEHWRSMVTAPNNNTRSLDGTTITVPKL